MSQSVTPRVFVSAPSSDLRTARKVINEALSRIECLPIEESIFGTDYGPVSEVLKRKIASCDAVIHVLGRDFGGEPTYRQGDQPMTRRSWSQIEYDIAKELNKKLYVFICDTSFPFDTVAGRESEDKAKLVAIHREAVLADSNLWHAVKDIDDLRQKVERLKLPLDEVRAQLTKVGSEVTATGRRVQVGLLAVFAMVILSIGIGINLSRVQRTDVRKGIDSLQTQLETVVHNIKLIPTSHMENGDREANNLETTGLSELATKMELLVKQLTKQTAQGGPTKEDELRIRRASAAIQYSKALELLEQGKTNDALQKYDQAIENYSTLVNDDSRADLGDILARSLQNRGVLRSHSVETRDRGIKDLDVAEKIFKNLVEDGRLDLQDELNQTQASKLMIVNTDGNTPASGEPKPEELIIEDRGSALPGITSEPSKLSTVVVKQLSGDPLLKEVRLYKAGTDDNVQRGKLGSPMLGEPGKYDVLAVSEEQQVMLVHNLELKENERKIINSDAIVGRIIFKPLTLPDFPMIKDAFLVKAGTDRDSTVYRLHTCNKFGSALLVEPGAFDVICTPVDGHFFTLKRGVEIKPGQTVFIDLNQHVAAIVCRDPQIDGLELEAIHIVPAGTEPRSSYTYLQKGKGFEVPMMVHAGEFYDLLLVPMEGIPIKFVKGISADEGKITIVKNDVN